MEHDDGDREPIDRFSSSALLARFAGRLAIAVEPSSELVPTVTTEAIDDEAWAATVSYHAHGRYQLAVRTVRSPVGLNPRGLYIESLASALSNFLSNVEHAPPDDSTDRGSSARPAPDIPAGGEQLVAASYLSHRQAAQLPESPVTIVIDDVVTAGIRITMNGFTAVKAQWGEQEVFSVGTPELMAGLRLRTVAAGDLHASLAR